MLLFVTLARCCNKTTMDHAQKATIDALQALMQNQVSLVSLLVYEQ